MPGLGDFPVLGWGDAKCLVSVFWSSLKVPNQFTFLLPPFSVLWLSLALFPGFRAVPIRKEGKTSSHHLVWTGSDFPFFFDNSLFFTDFGLSNWNSYSMQFRFCFLPPLEKIFIFIFSIFVFLLWKISLSSHSLSSSLCLLFFFCPAILYFNFQILNFQKLFSLYYIFF